MTDTMMISAFLMTPVSFLRGPAVGAHSVAAVGPRGTIISNPFQHFQRSYLPTAPGHGLVTRE